MFAIVSTLVGKSVQENVMKIENTNRKHRGVSTPKQSTETNASLPETNATLPEKWISQLFQEAERMFTMSSNVTDQCREDYKTYEMHLKNQSVWAVRSSYSI